uniref:Uncharacterized protein n=1 Tax=Anopheles dirus TaxID=7168 RepID=A0A182NUD2_9DIPT
MKFFRQYQQHAELSYQPIYDSIHWFLKIALLRIFDDDFLVAPIPKAIYYFIVSQMVTTLGLIVLHGYNYRDDTDTVILSVSAFFGALEVLLKLFGMVYRRKQLVQMIDTVLRDRSFQDGPHEAAICGKYMRLARKLQIVTKISYQTTGIMLFMYPVVAGKIGDRVLPMGYSIPFADYRLYPWYPINYVAQVVLMNWVATMFIGLDGPFYMFVCYSASQLEIAIVYLRQIGQCPDNEAEQRRLIRKVFDIHTELSRCSDIYREVYLMQMLCSIVHICVSLFHIQIKLNNSSYGMLLTNVNKVWLFCYCGELVVSKAAEFGTAVYANHWYQLWNRRDLRDILFMLCNAQRNYGFSVGGFGFLAFATFTSVMKTAYSCNAFLHRVMN